MDEQQVSVLEVIRKLGIVPVYGWEARFDHKCKIKCRPFTVPRASQMRDILGMSLRLVTKHTTFSKLRAVFSKRFFYIKKRFIQHRLPFIDAVSHVPWRPIYGVPIGGIGSGSIGRGYRGEFCRSSLIPGMYSYDVQPVDQFIVTVRKNGVTVYHQVLSPLTKPPSNAKKLKKWKWGFDPEKGHYLGLYPRSWTVYEIPELQLVLVYQQISPVIPHDYQTTCLPVAVFYWKVISWNKENLKVTITFSWHGPNHRKRTKSSDFSKSEDGNNSSENTTNTHVSTAENAFPTCSQRSTAFSTGDFLKLNCQGKKLKTFTDLSWLGWLVGYTVPLDSKAKKSPKLAIAVSATTNVPRCNITDNLNPSQSELEFAITWHSPIVKFRTGDVVYTRRYVRWFPVDRISGAKLLLAHAIDNWRQWVQKIEDWQNPILSNQSLPSWYKSALFNELYYLSDGGTVWLDPIQVDCFKSDLLNLTEDMKVDSWDHRARLSREIGLFGYLEGHEYRMYNTYDVHHYASWALIKLWPKIQLALNYDCADLTIAEDSTSVYYIGNGKALFRSSECAVVHDFGDPEDEPWRCTNAYIMFPTDTWKDLNSKFILQVWRDWRITQDHQYLLYMLPIVLRILRKSLVAWDSDDDGLIENSGFPDQTYDVWTAKGLTAYTGGMWLSCLYATFDMLSWCLKSDSPVYDQIVNNTDDTQRSWSEIKDEVQTLFTKARDSYNAKLWTGR
ncbi:bile acid beta-glucosidase-related [Schistosoma mansoni]|uniref:bile acid beta-glucosidase-related n=1 Tax=Schistosoma mansoni TaxID=6183 RepID=UPI00022DC436|nr:bile acid beta-glucosidase-related [Schistosoma mansoni]|eukprot:XP_018652105.1 bile acid beta-glucosidase-related [Schistosoma mansoni]